MAKFLFLLFVFVVGWRGTVAAQSFQIEQSQIEIAVAPEFNHAGLRVPISGTANGFNYAGLSATSDASWVIPSVDAASGEVALSFQTAGLISSATGTITVSGNGTTDSFFVKATIAPLNVVKLEDDPLRSRTYGVHQNGVNLGALIVVDPITNTKIACVTVGKKPADVAVARDGNELLVINCVDETVTAIDLASLRVKETIALTQYDNWGVDDTTADVAYGPGSTIYYTDGAWAPALRVFDRATRQVIQTVLDSTYGFGDFALTRDGKNLIGWWQYGWSAGSASSNITKYSVDTQGKLTFSERTNTTYPTGMMRDPLDSPVLIDADSKYSFIKQLAVNTAAVTDTYRTFPKTVYSISPGGEIAVTDTAIYQTSTGINLLNLPVTTTVQAITSDYSRLVYFNKTNRTIGTIDLLAAVGPAVLNRNLSPADGSITLAPQKLEWSPLPGVDRYQVYLGQSETEVGNAVTTSPSYLGEVNTSSIQITRTLTPGTRYYWRVDAVTSSGNVKGTVYDFTVSLIGTDLTSIQTATVQGHSAHKVAVQLTSTTPQAWQATADQAWVKFESSTGTTPSTLTVILDASQLQKGVHSAQVSIALASGGQSAFTFPVTLEVEPLAITVMESDRASGLVYAISEDKTQAGSSRAYLLEIDTVAKALKRVVRVGTSATDLAVHNEDGRVYVTNWMTGSLLALDKTTLAQVRAYGFAPIGGGTYGGDVYRIAAGAKGRLLVEEQDQWVDISIFDTDKGTKLKDAYVREGGGEFGPGGRFYYHGENNSSGAELIKFDVIGDVFTEIASKRVESYSYYGSRTVVVSENGERVFWNGGALNKDLAIEWLIGKEIYATTPDGKYAFGEELIYDVDSKQAVLSMPAKTKVSAFNSTSGKLVVQSGAQLAFFEVKTVMTFPAPVLSVGTVTAASVQLNWTDESLETGFTLQRRIVGSTVWVDITANLAANATSYTVTGLLPSTAYEFRIKADSASTSSDWSTVLPVTTQAIPVPTVATAAATGISATGAGLSGNVNPNGVATTAYFEYGLTSDYGSTTTSTSVGQGTASVAVSRTLSGLLPGTTYYYRLVAVNSGGTIKGNGLTFSTPINQPAVSAGTATTVGSTSATVNGTVNPNGSPTTVRFEYGLTTAYGNTTVDTSAGSGTASVAASRSIDGLLPGTTYYYRLVATNAGGTSFSTSRAFTTPSQVGGVPSAQTTAAIEVGTASAILAGRVNPNGAVAFAYFEYGTGTTYGQSTPEASMNAGSTSVDVSKAITGLSSGTTYHYRVVARNSSGITYGLDQTFKTAEETLQAVDDEAFTTGRESVVIDVLANDSGSSSSALQIAEVGVPSAGNAYVNGDGSLTYTPSAAFKGVDTFTYRVGNNTGKTALATVVVRDSFQACAGVYNGLVGTSESEFSRAGVITIKASPLGTFTGTLKFAGKTHRLKGKLRYDGEASVDIGKAGGERLSLSLRIDPASRQLTGVVGVQGEAVQLGGTRVAFDAFNNPAPEAGQYTVLLSRNNDPGVPPGHGFATMRVATSGSISITGRTERGAPFSSVAYIGSDRRFPFYAAPKSVRPSSLQGWVDFRSVAGVSDCDGIIGYSALLPLDEPSVRGPVQLSLIGSRYILPLSGRLLLPWHDGQDNGLFEFGGGGSSLENPLILSLTADHKIKIKAGRKHFSMKVDPKTGVFSGTFSVTKGTKPASFHGVLFQRQAMGAGFFRSSQGGGWVTFEEDLTESAVKTVE